MNTPHEYTAAQLDALDAAAVSWQGTPFCAGAPVKGAGVCCHTAVAEIYFEAQWMPRFAVPLGSPQYGRAGSTPEMEEFLDASPHFTDADPARDLQAISAAVRDERRQLTEAERARISAIALPGRLVLSRPARLPWHLSIALRGGRYVHAVIGHAVQIPPQLPDVWAKRLWRAWRPLC